MSFALTTARCPLLNITGGRDLTLHEVNDAMDDSGSATIFRHRFAKSFDRATTWPAAVSKNSPHPG